MTAVAVDIDEAKAALLAAMREQSGSKRDFESEIASVFTNDDDFELAVGRIRAELQAQKDTPFAAVDYDTVFDEKVLKALDTKGLKNAVEDYIRRYNQLLNGSTYFKKGTFDCDQPGGVTTFTIDALKAYKPS